MSSKLIILDRDGVINQDSDDYIRSPEQWIPIPGSIEAMAMLARAGFTLAVATNQSGLGRGYFDEYALANMHQLMCSLVEERGGEIAGVFFCPHRPDENCNCRKPKTGLLDQMEQEFSTPVAGSWYIGDAEKDLDCALSKNCRPILVLTGKGSGTLDSLSPDKRERILVFANLLEAARHILGIRPGQENGSD